MIPAQWWVFRRPEREASWLTVAQAALQGVSLSAFLSASPFDPHSTGHSSGTFQNYPLTGKKKPSPQNAYWYLDHMIPEPSTCLCPLCPPSPSRVTVRKDWWYPVLTLYLGAVVLNSLFLRNMQHSVGSLGYMFSSCLWPWGDVFSCRKTPNLPLWPLQIMLNSSPNCSRTETWLGRSKGSIIKSPSTRQIPVLPACLVMFFSSLKKSFLLNRHLHSCSENGGWEA